MPTKTRVVLVGASGETGGTIAEGLLESIEKFELIALARPASLDKPEYHSLQARGFTVVPADLTTVNNDLISALHTADVVISCLLISDMQAANNLATACYKAGVGRYVPSFFGPVCPPRGVMRVRDLKEDHFDFIKKMYLPFTIIDVGWWYQMSLPLLPSHKIDNLFAFPFEEINGDGNTQSALIDHRDIGKYVARIITDPRTLNKSVFVYNEVWTQTRVFEVLEKVSGETIPRKYVDERGLMAKINDAKFSGDEKSLIVIAHYEYDYSREIRGDNTPEHAKYLGYLDGKELYPDIKGRSMEDYIAEVVNGSAKRLYDGRYEHCHR